MAHQNDDEWAAGYHDGLAAVDGVNKTVADLSAQIKQVTHERNNLQRNFDELAGTLPEHEDGPVAAVAMLRDELVDAQEEIKRLQTVVTQIAK